MISGTKVPFNAGVEGVLLSARQLAEKPCQCCGGVWTCIVWWRVMSTGANLCGSLIDSLSLCGGDVHMTPSAYDSCSELLSCVTNVMCFKGAFSVFLPSPLPPSLPPSLGDKEWGRSKKTTSICAHLHLLRLPTPPPLRLACSFSPFPPAFPPSLSPLSLSPSLPPSFPP